MHARTYTALPDPSTIRHLTCNSPCSFVFAETFGMLPCNKL
jgi:hypothetical protein